MDLRRDPVIVVGASLGDQGGDNITSSDRRISARYLVAKLKRDIVSTSAPVRVPVQCSRAAGSASTATPRPAGS